MRKYLVPVAAAAAVMTAPVVAHAEAPAAQIVAADS